VEKTHHLGCGRCNINFWIISGENTPFRARKMLIKRFDFNGIIIYQERTPKKEKLVEKRPYV